MKKWSLFFSTLLFLNVVNAQRLDGFTAESTASQIALETLLAQTIDTNAFRAHLKILTAQPHVAGNPANEKVRDYMFEVMENAGWKSDLYPYDVYMSNHPGQSSVELVTPMRLPLNQQEYILPEDSFSSHPNLWKGWNAYSGSGDVVAQVVYANYGRKEDFEMLESLGVSVEGKIVLARYGGNFRGFKAKFAEANGAAGLIIFTDPEDAGYMRGLTFPEGAFYNESTIQRGSLLTTDFTGDPLTPFEPALPRDGKRTVERLNPDHAQLHTIPVTPISYGSAKKIMERMEGEAVPVSWQGGLPFTYRLTGGEDLNVRLKVNQPRDFVRVYDVIGTLKGSEYPDEWIILGCHYDAWGYGATDPNSGTAMLLSLSETLGKLAEDGYRPKRSILIGHWDAEEHGVIGSAEWVEQMKEELGAKAIAYLNFDGGVSGQRFGASAAPTLKRLITEAARKVEYPYSDNTVYEEWAGKNEEPIIGNLGGGSDHIAFYMHVGVPSLSGGAGGPTLYHSNYDDYFYYATHVDPQFQMGPTIEQLVGIMSLRLANAEVIPYDINRYATDLTMHFENATEKVMRLDSTFAGFSQTSQALITLEKTSNRLDQHLKSLLSEGAINKKEQQSINQQLIELEKSFIENKGMDFGSWYRSLYAASDPFSGYASWILPGIEYELAQQTTDRLEIWDARYAAAVERLNRKMESLIVSIEE